MPQSELTLRDYLNIFRRRSWIVALGAALGVLGAFVLTARQTPLYQSSAVVLINQTSASEIYDPLGGGSPYSYAERLAENEARFLGSGLVADAAIEALGYEAYIDVRTDDYADVLTIFATSSDPTEAQEVAQTYAETYVEVRKERFRAERLSTANKLAEQLAEVDLQLVDAGEEDRARLLTLRRDLADSLDLLSITVNLAENTGAQVIDDAQIPASPFTPRPNRNIVLGGVLGLLIGGGLVLGLEALDRSVRSREMLEALTPGAPNLAGIPAVKSARGREDLLVTVRNPTGAGAEAFRTLRAALQYVAVDDQARVIQIASAHSAAGKTTVSANLAVALAQAGRSVAVIDADLRRPRIHQLFDVAQAPGLTSAIIGSAPLDRCIQKIPDVDGGKAWVMPSGPIPPGPSELLGSKAASAIISKLAELVDYVIIDTPPVLAVADTVVLSQHVDASILVVDAKKTRRADVVEAYERLQQASAPVVGTVLNKLSRRPGSSRYGYGYGYGDGTGRAGVLGWFSRGGEDDTTVERLSDGESSTMATASSPGSGAPGSRTVRSERSAASTSTTEASASSGAHDVGAGKSTATTAPTPVADVEPATPAVAEAQPVASSPGGRSSEDGDEDRWEDDFDIKVPPAAKG